MVKKAIVVCWLYAVYPVMLASQRRYRKDTCKLNAPSTVDILSHGAIDVNCTLGEFCQGFTSNNLAFFTHKNRVRRNLSREWWRIVDAKTLSVNIANSTEFLGDRKAYSIYCELPGVTRRSIYVEAHDPPVAPTNVQCSVVNMNLQCTWKVKAENHCRKTTLNTILSADQYISHNSKSCRMENCELSTRLDQHGEMTGHLQCLTRKNMFHDTYTFSLYTRDIERPAQIEDLIISPASRSVHISWRSHDPREQLYSAVVSHLQWAINRTDERTTRNTSLVLGDLRPYTNYMLSVRGRFITHGEWSKQTTSHFRTPPDIPDRNPWIPAGSWSVDEKHNVDIIFQKINPSEENHYPTFKYIAEILGQNKSTTHYTCQANVCRVPIPANEDATVAVRSVNMNGFAKGSPSEILIPGITDTAPAENITVLILNRTAFRVAWSEPTPSIFPTANYTLYWRSRNSGSNIEFRTVRPSTDESDINLGVKVITNVMQVGISRVTSRGDSCGIKWLTQSRHYCFYDIRKAPGPPTNLKYIPTQAPKIIWERPDCSGHRGFPYKYYIKIYTGNMTDSNETHIMMDSAIVLPTHGNGHLEWVLHNLEHSGTYTAVVQSVAIGGATIACQKQLVFLHQVVYDWHRTGMIIGIFITLLFIPSLVSTIWWSRKFIRKYRKGIYIRTFEATENFIYEKPNNERLLYNGYFKTNILYNKVPTVTADSPECNLTLGASLQMQIHDNHHILDWYERSLLHQLPNDSVDTDGYLKMAQDSGIIPDGDSISYRVMGQNGRLVPARAQRVPPIKLQQRQYINTNEHRPIELEHISQILPRREIPDSYNTDEYIISDNEDSRPTAEELLENTEQGCPYLGSDNSSNNRSGYIMQEQLNQQLCQQSQTIDENFCTYF